MFEDEGGFFLRLLSVAHSAARADFFPTLNCVVSILGNFSVSSTVARDLVDQGQIPLFTAILKRPDLRQGAAQLLCNIAADRRSFSLFEEFTLNPLSDDMGVEFLLSGGLEALIAMLESGEVGQVQFVARLLERIIDARATS